MTTGWGITGCLNPISGKPANRWYYRYARVVMGADWEQEVLDLEVLKQAV